MWMMMLVVALSILTLSLGTVRDLRVPLNSCQYRDYLSSLISQASADDYSFQGTTLIFLRNMSCSTQLTMVRSMADDMYDFMYDYYTYNNSHNSSYTSTAETSQFFETLKYDYEYYYDQTSYGLENNGLFDAISVIRKLPDVTKRLDILTFLDIALLVVFTVEMVLRLATCPNYKRFFKSSLNVLDILIILSAYAGLVMEFEYTKYRYKEKGLKVFLYLQMLRVLRVIRYIRHVPAVSVLTYTIRTKFKDLAVLVLFILVGVVIFGNIAYFVEDNFDFVDIPTSWWWCLITMTTVGYGDVVPRTAQGKVIGSVCALCGVLCISLTIPVFVNSFILLHRFSKLHKKTCTQIASSKVNTITPTTAALPEKKGVCI